MRRLWVPFAVLTLLFLCGPAAAKPKGKLAKQHAKAARTAKQQLGELFTEAMKAEHLYQAVIVARALVRFDPEHGEARDHLGDEKKDGKWVVSDYIDHDDEDEDAAEAFKARCDTARAALAAPLRELLKHKKAKKGSGARRHLIEDLAALLPDDDAIRELHRFTVRDGYWITRDVPFGETTWRKWGKAVDRTLRRKTSLWQHELPKELQAIDVPLKLGFKMAYMRGWSTLYHREISYGGKRVIAARDMLRAAFDEDAELPVSLAFVVVETAEQYEKVVDTFLLAGPAKQDALGRKVANVGKGGRLVLIADGRDAAAKRMVCTTMYESLSIAFGMGKESEWLLRGLSSVMEFITCGARLTMLGSPGKKRSATDLVRRLEREMLEKDASWPSLARDLLKTKQLPSLASVVSMARNEIYVAEMLTCYLVSVYAALVFPDETRALLKALAKDMPAKEAIPKTIGLSLADLEKRAIRYWKDNGGTEDWGEKVTTPLPR